MIEKHLRNALRGILAAARCLHWQRRMSMRSRPAASDQPNRERCTWLANKWGKEPPIAERTYNTSQRIFRRSDPIKRVSCRLATNRG